jgi:hypothetical protein
MIEMTDADATQLAGKSRLEDAFGKFRSERTDRVVAHSRDST